MKMSWLYEKRPLKKPRLGPPDVYPQDPKQKEDELTAINVKQGFLTHPSIPEEYGSARNSGITASDFGAFFSALLSKKQELNTFQDIGKKKPPIIAKDSICLVTARTKNIVDQWFRDLSTNAKTLTQLSRKVPIFNKKEEIFIQLYDSQVPMLKACWFIKIASNYALAISESGNKSKKRQLPDQSQDWTNALTKYLHGLYVKLFEIYHGNLNSSSLMQNSNNLSLSSSSHSANNSSSNLTSSSVNSITGAGSTNVNTSSSNSSHNLSSQTSSSSQSLTSSSQSSTNISSQNPSNLSSSANSNQNMSTTGANGQTMINSVNTESVYLQWQYCTQLAHYLFEEGLLDKHEFLLWILDLFEKIKSPDDSMMRIVVPLLVQYSDDYTQSELLSRRLAYHCGKKLSLLVSEPIERPQITAITNETINGDTQVNGTSNTSNSTSVAANALNNSTNNSSTSNGNSPVKLSSNPLVNSFRDLLNCSHHRSIVYCLSAILQSITLRCRAALVWNNIGENKISLALNGSPLDYLPCPPSQLPMPARPGNSDVRAQLREAEEEICIRSKAVEMKWCIERLQQATPGVTINRLLNTLDALDRHCFGKVDSVNCLDVLYSKIFTPANTSTTFSSCTSNVPSTVLTGQVNTTPAAAVVGHVNNSINETKNLSEIIAEDEPIIKLLCEWAVTSKRSGEHRALVVAKLLDKRQNELVIEKDVDFDKEDKMDVDTNVCSSNNNNNSVSDIKKESDNKTVTAVSSTTQPATNNASVDNTLPIFQDLLTSFLDTQAPVLDEVNPSSENRLSFANLVLLFGELIRCDVFSHDAYMCSLISRGQFSNSPGNSSVLLSQENKINPVNEVSSSLTRFVPMLASGSATPTTNGLTNILSNNHTDTIMTNGNNNLLNSTQPPNIQSSLAVTQRQASDSTLPMFEPVVDGQSKAEQTLSWEIDMNGQQMDMDDARIDADLDKILQHINIKQQNNMNDQTDILLPDSVNSDKEDEVFGSTNPVASNSNSENNTNKRVIQRHLLFTLHFPLTQDETSYHDCNQRHILLYGVGRARDDARHSVKKVTKDILKLFNRKSSMDITEGGKIKKPAVKEGFSFENALNRFQSLSYFDQHVVTSSCTTACIEMFTGVSSGSSNYLPLIESIAFLFDLIEISLNIHGLIDFIIQLLKEMVEIEIQLQQKCPFLAGSYCTSIGLYIVGILYRYHNCLLVLTDETVAIFDGLFKLIKHVLNPAECSSAERCILGYLHDLLTCAHLRFKHHDQFIPLQSKIKQTLYTSLQPSAVTVLWSTSVMIDYINNPKMKIDMNQIKQLNENTAYRYSFICNAFQAIVSARDPNRLNEISILCAELTSRSSVLSNDWLGVLKALCCSSKPHCGFIDVLTQVDVRDLTIHDNLAIFTTILIARRCISLQDFVIHCALPSLLDAKFSTAANDAQNADAGARLTCHLLLCLFRASEPPLSSSSLLSTPATTLYSLTSPGPSTLVNANPTQQKSLYVIKHPCDRYLLTAAHSSMRVEAVLAVLKGILVLGDSIEEREMKDKPEGDQEKEISISDILGLDDADFSDFGLGLFSGSRPRQDGSNTLETANLGEFAKHVLKQICNQEWVHDRCLRDSELLIKEGLLLDPMLSYKQAQQLLQMICHPKGQSQNIVNSNNINSANNNNNSNNSNNNAGKEIDQKQQISKILQNLDEWTIRISWLQLQLMFAQANADVTVWLDNVAKATIDFFQQSSEESAKCNTNGLSVPTSSKDNINNCRNNQSPNKQNINDGKDKRVWLVAPLIAKLPSAVQGKILRVAANVLESGNWMSVGMNNSQNSYNSSYSSSKNKDRGFQQQKSSNSGGSMNNGPNLSSSNSTSALLSYSPFLSLVLMCLKGQDEQRGPLLDSLYSQLQQAVHERPNDDVKIKCNIQDGLQLRLSLVGGMFDMIQKSSSLMDWAVLLLQLISYGVVDPQLNYELFTTVLDMLAILIHTTQATDSFETREETRKQYQNLIKKLKKELTTDRFGIGVKLVRQLLTLQKQQCEVITCEPMGSLIDTKGNKIAGFDSIDKKQGLQVAEMQKVLPWDLLQGYKNPAPLCWTWFGAVRIERKPLRGEEDHYRQSWHTHIQRKPISYYLEPPPLPPEDELEPMHPPAPPPPPSPIVPQITQQSAPPPAQQQPQSQQPHLTPQPQLNPHPQIQPQIQTHQQFSHPLQTTQQMPSHPQMQPHAQLQAHQQMTSHQQISPHPQQMPSHQQMPPHQQIPTHQQMQPIQQMQSSIHSTISQMQPHQTMQQMPQTQQNMIPTQTQSTMLEKPTMMPSMLAHNQMMQVPVVEDQIKREPMTPNEVTNVRGMAGAKKPKPQRRRRQTKNAMNVIPQPAPAPQMRQYENYGNQQQTIQGAPQTQQNSQQWYQQQQNNPVQQQQQQQQQQTFYSQGTDLVNAGQARFEARPNSKQVLNSILRARQPGGGAAPAYMNQNTANNANQTTAPATAMYQPRHQMMQRQQMQQAQQQAQTQMQSQQQQMSSQQQQMGLQQNQMYQMANNNSQMVQQNTVHMSNQSQNYGNPNVSYNNNMQMPIMDQMQNYQQQSQQQQPQQVMMNTQMRAQLQQQQQQQQQQFVSQRPQYISTPNVTINQMHANQGYANQTGMQGMQQSAANIPPTHMRQPMSQQQQQMLQRQLSSGKPQQGYQQGPY